MHRAQAIAIDVDEGEDTALVAGDADNVGDEARGEAAACAHHGDLDGAAHGAGERKRGGGFGVFSVAEGFFLGSFEEHRGGLLKRTLADSNYGGDAKAVTIKCFFVI